MVDTAELTRPIIGIENRTAREVFDIMVDRIRRLEAPADRVEKLEAALRASEDAFEAIRLILIKHLDEPERHAFWKAVSARDAIRAAISTERASK